MDTIRFEEQQRIEAVEDSLDSMVAPSVEDAIELLELQQ